MARTFTRDFPGAWPSRTAWPRQEASRESSPIVRTRNGRPERSRRSRCVLKESDRGRLPDLLPIRYARMRASPFAFFRGAAALMAADLATTPATGIRVQACGDCHVANFGGFGTPERQLVFDINDFDETLPRALGMGRQAPGSEHRAGHARGGFCRTPLLPSGAHRRRILPDAHARIRGDDRAGRLVLASERCPFHRTREDSSRPEAMARSWKPRPPSTLPNVNSRKLRRCGMAVPASSTGRPLIYHPREMARSGSACGECFSKYRDTLPEERRIASRSLRTGGCRPQGRRSRQRRHALRGGVADGRAARSSVPAIQGSARIGARAVCGQKPVCESRRASRHRPAASAVRQRHFSWLDQRRPAATISIFASSATCA